MMLRWKSLWRLLVVLDGGLKLEAGIGQCSVDIATSFCMVLVLE
jgi:hypothetical protein